MVYARFIVFPVVGALLGFITNFIAIKLLFRPKKRVLGFQGLLPKRQKELAKKAGEIVNNYLVNSEDIRLQLNRESLERAVDNYLDRNKNLLWEIGVARKFIKTIVVSLLIDSDGYFNKNIIESIIDNEMVSKIVQKKIEEFDIMQLENIIKKASGHEIRFIIITGAILGFVIGLIEALLKI